MCPGAALLPDLFFFGCSFQVRAAFITSGGRQAPFPVSVTIFGKTKRGAETLTSSYSPGNLLFGIDCSKNSILFNSSCSLKTSSLSKQIAPLWASRSSNNGKEQNDGFVSNRNRIVFPPSSSTSGRRDVIQRRGDALASTGRSPDLLAAKRKWK